jgi:uncharacterized OB-fold protein
MSEPQTRPFTAASFSQYLSEGKLMASRCLGCGRLHLPPRAICPGCHGDQMAWAKTSGRGRLAAFTAVHIGLSSMAAEGYSRDNPYLCGIVALDEGPSVSARLLGLDARQPAASAIGTPLTVEFVRNAAGEAVLAFRA